MAEVSLDQLLEKIPNKFNLVMVAAKRARQIKDGSARLVVTHSVNPVTIALEEILHGKIVLDESGIRVTGEFLQPDGSAALVKDAMDDLLSLPDMPDPGLLEVLPLSERASLLVDELLPDVDELAATGDSEVGR